MAYDEGLARWIRGVLDEVRPPELVDKRMFSGVGFMVQGNMACAVNSDQLIVRVGSDFYEDALADAHVGSFDLDGQPMKGWVSVGSEGYESDDQFRRWVQLGIELVLSLPPKR